MIKMKNKIFPILVISTLLVAFLGLNSCFFPVASLGFLGINVPRSAKFVPVEKHNPNKGLVYIYRSDHPKHPGASPEITLNQQELIELQNGGYIAISLKDDRYSLFSTEVTFLKIFDFDPPINTPETFLEFQVRAGETYYIRWKLGEGLKLLEEKEALPEIRETHFTEPEFAAVEGYEPED